MLKRVGVNVDYQAPDWGMVVQRRALTKPPAEGGWNLFCTGFSGLDFFTPASHLPLRGNGRRLVRLARRSEDRGAARGLVQHPGPSPGRRRSERRSSFRRSRTCLIPSAWCIDAFVPRQHHSVIPAKAGLSASPDAIRGLGPACAGVTISQVTRRLVLLPAWASAAHDRVPPKHHRRAGGLPDLLERAPRLGERPIRTRS